METAIKISRQTGENMSTTQEPITIYRENRIFLFEAREGVLKCEWGPRNEGPENKRRSAGTVKIKDFTDQTVAQEFLIKRAKKQIDAIEDNG